jgi:regulator of sirC expression with transglutaminase-like and TPR domain
MKRLLSLLFVALVLFGTFAQAEELKIADEVEKFFTPGRLWIDIKLDIDRLVDPSVANETTKVEYLKLVAAMKQIAKQIPPRNAHEKLLLVKHILYKPGWWNENRAFAYDLSDPYGREARHKTLNHYLSTRKGNCVTMPILMVLLGREIGADMTLASAPRHLLAKLRDEHGKVWSIEATSGGGYTRDSHYRKEMPMTDLAVASGLYLRTLTDGEAVAEMATTVVEAMVRAQRHDDVIRASNVILKHNKLSVYAMIARASAFGKVLETQILPNMEVVPEAYRDIAEVYWQENQMGFRQAENLGWTERDGLKDQWPDYQGQ